MALPLLAALVLMAMECAIWRAMFGSGRVVYGIHQDTVALFVAAVGSADTTTAWCRPGTTTTSTSRSTA